MLASHQGSKVMYNKQPRNAGLLPSLEFKLSRFQSGVISVGLCRALAVFIVLGDSIAYLKSCLGRTADRLLACSLSLSASRHECFCVLRLEVGGLWVLWFERLQMFVQNVLEIEITCGRNDDTRVENQ